MMSYDYPHPVSRTYQYKKITKPLLERKRRARINRCLEELKDLMMHALETEGENISKLEKADILELTVRHLQRLQASRPSGLSTSGTSNEDISAESRWQSGFGHCAAEACRFLSALPGEAAERLAKHLASGLQAPRQLNSIATKPNAVSNTIANLERTANIVAPCRSSDQTSNVTVSEERLVTQPYPVNRVENRSPTSDQNISSPKADNKFKSNSAISSAIISSSSNSSKNENYQPNLEEEEEIDVERIDENNDPMWRPW